MALDSRPENIVEETAQGSREEYRNSKTVQAITELMVDRYRAGGSKYGVFIDDAVVPTEITGETSFAEMAMNEALDGLTYAFKAREEVNTLRAEVAHLQDLLKKFSEVTDKLTEQNAELVDRLDEANAQLELLQGERAELHQRGSMTTDEEAELTHANLALSVENETLKAELKRIKEVGRRLYTEYKLTKNKNENLTASLNKIPKRVKGFYNA